MNPYEDADACEGPDAVASSGVQAASSLQASADLDGELFDETLDLDADSSDDGL